MGDLKDVTEHAREAGIGCPVAVTSVTWYECVEVEGRDPAAETERLRHLLDSLRDAIPLLDGGRKHVEFPVKVADKIRPGTTRVFHLEAFRGTSDDGEPVITVKFPCERYYWDEDLPLRSGFMTRSRGTSVPTMRASSLVSLKPPRIMPRCGTPCRWTARPSNTWPAPSGAVTGCGSSSARPIPIAPSRSALSPWMTLEPPSNVAPVRRHASRQPSIGLSSRVNSGSRRGWFFLEEEFEVVCPQEGQRC